MHQQPGNWLTTLIPFVILAVVLALLSKVPLSMLAKRIWLAVLAFTGVIAAPALFLIPGQAIYTLPFVDWTVTCRFSCRRRSTRNSNWPGAS